MKKKKRVRESALLDCTSSITAATVLTTVTRGRVVPWRKREREEKKRLNLSPEQSSLFLLGGAWRKKGEKIR